MSIQTRKSSQWFYARWKANGKVFCRRLDVKIVGKPGERRYEEARSRAMEQAKALRISTSWHTADFYRKMADALEADAAQRERTEKRPSVRLDNLVSAWARTAHRGSALWAAAVVRDFGRLSDGRRRAGPS